MIERIVDFILALARSKKMRNFTFLARVSNLTLLASGRLAVAAPYVSMHVNLIGMVLVLFGLTLTSFLGSVEPRFLMGVLFGLFVFQIKLWLRQEPCCV